MKTTTERFLAALEKQLYEISLTNEKPVAQYKLSVLTCKKALNKIKNYIRGYTFENTAEEITFFKIIKPRFYAQYIYYINLYNFAVQRPVGGNDIQEAYIRLHQAEIKNFFEHNRSFYLYYRAGMDQLDQAYFTRGQFDVHTELDDFEENEHFSTSHDYKLSKIIANEKFQDYLNLELLKLNTNPEDYIIQLPFTRPTWTASQTDAIELIYALKANGAINQGNIDIAELVTLWEYVFQADLKQAYHKYADITRRKKETALFLTKLAEALKRWIDSKLGL